MLQKAAMADYPALCDLYRDACRAMEASGLDLWHWGQYPCAEILEEDIRQGALYLYRENDVILACLALNLLPEEDYAGVTWRIPGRAGYFHRVAVSPSAQGRGIAGRMLAAGEEILRALDCQALRGNVSSRNPRAIRLYERCGFVQAGPFCADWCEAPDFAWALEKAL